MNTGIIRRPNIFDIEYLAENARESDKLEVFLFAQRTIGEVLNNTPGIFDNSNVWEMDGKLVCMYGATVVSGTGHIVWMLATDEFEDHKDLVRQHSKKVFADLIKDKKYLFNYVHAKHEAALRWIKWLGCKVHEPEPVGFRGEMFCKFEVINV